MPRPTFPRPSGLRQEIIAALVVKAILLAGLWFLIFAGKTALLPGPILPAILLCPPIFTTYLKRRPLMFGDDVVMLSRMQFGLTALYHFCLYH